MNGLLDATLLFVLLLNFLSLGSSRIRAVIRAVALQGVVLGAMPLFVDDPGLSAIVLAAATMALKGIVIPSMLMRTLRDLPIRREVEPLLGFTTSLVLGAVGTGLAIAFAARLPLAPGAASQLIVPASLSTVLCGFLVLITRKKAITQVTGYLMLENGIFIFGLMLLHALPALVEVGVLLDLFVAIFVMGILINHISREFSSADTEHLAELRE